MKYVKLKIEFISQCLASGRQGNDYDEFEKTSDGSLIWKQAWWYAALTKAINIAAVKGVKPNNFDFKLAVDAPVSLHKRTYNRHSVRVHEAIMPGTQVEFEAAVAPHVTRSNLEQVFDTMGSFVGMTPFGYGLGFGKFKVIDITVTEPDN